MENLKICLVGRARSGKSEAAEYIKSHFYPMIETIDFGDSLKEVVKILYSNTEDIKTRETLQTIGQHMRKLNEDIWIDCVDRKINNIKDKNIICASCRQQNEYDYLKSKGFIFIKINCANGVRLNRMINCGDKFNKNCLNHETEMLVDDFIVDYAVDNNSNIEYLHYQLEKILRDIQGE